MRSEPVITITNRIGYWGCWALTIAAAALLVSQAVSGGLHSLTPALGPCVLVACAAWTLWGWPRLRLDADGLTVSNPFTATRVPWAHLQGAENAWGLVLLVDGRRLRAAAAPMSGGTSTKGLRRPGPGRQQELLAAALASNPGPLESRADHANAAFQADRDLTLRLDASSAVPLVTDLRDRRLCTARPDAVHRTWRWERVALVVLGVAATVVFTL